MDVTVEESYAYVADYFGGLRIVEISDPTAPVEVGFYDTPDSAFDVVVSDGYAYIADGSSGMRMLDISSPTVPVEVGFYNTGGFASGVALGGGVVYLADEWGGLFVLRLRCSADIGFEPLADGYRFSNSASEWGWYPLLPASEDYTTADMRRMFGDDCVCRMVGPVCFVRWDVIRWNAQVNWDMNDGHCDGMASTSLRLFKNLDAPEDFQAGASITHDLQLSSVRRHIAYYFVEQYTDPVRTFKEQVLRYRPTTILYQLCTAMSRDVPDPTTLFVRQAGQGGHVVTPYAIEDQGDGVYWVRVYDNNHPDDTDRHVIINTSTDTWSYDLGWTTYGGDAGSHTLGIVPISKYAEQPVCRWNSGAGDLTGTSVGDIWLTGHGHLLIIDGQGRRIGYVGDEFVSEIPGAHWSRVDGGLGIELEPIYTVPLSEAYTILLDGQAFTQTEAVGLTQYGPGYAAWVDGIALGPTSQGIMTIAPDGSQLAFLSSDENEVRLALALNGTDEGLQFQIGNADVGTGQVVTLTADVVADQLVFNNAQASGGQYDLDARRVTAVGEESFVHTGVMISATDTHFLDYGAWNGSGLMKLYIDHASDGSIDETIELENEAANGAHRVYLPFVMKDD